MKNLCLIVFLFVLSINIYADTISINTARETGLNFINYKSNSRTYNSFAEEICIRENGVPVFYIFNLPVNEGFVIVSSENTTVPVLAYSLKGKFDTATIPGYMNTWVNHYKNQIIKSSENKMSPVHPSWEKINNKRLLKYAKASVAPLMSTEWNQNSPYNDSCPGGSYTGCVATAMAQIIRYWNHSQTGYHFHSYTDLTYGNQYVDYGASTYDFDLMPDKISSSSPEEEISQVAKLMYHCGVSVNMKYSTSSSSSSPQDIPDALSSYFKFAPTAYMLTKAYYSETEWENILKKEINEQRPIIYRGENPDTSISASHAFICDGYDNDNYFHFNWGWGGYYDGYFYLSALNPSTKDYTADQKAIINIRPVLSPELIFPYIQDFESGLTDEILTYKKAIISTEEKKSGLQSIILTDTSSGNINRFYIKVNVPASGAFLSFWTKRGHSNSSLYVKESVIIKPEYWVEELSDEQNLDTIFFGDYNDIDWVKYEHDLSPWSGQNITIMFEQYDNSSSRSNFMYIDDISITETSLLAAEKDNKGINIYTLHDNLFIDVSSNTSGEVFIYNITGKPVYSSKLEKFSQYRIPAPGVYIVNITTQEKSWSKKIAIY